MLGALCVFAQAAKLANKEPSAIILIIFVILMVIVINLSAFDRLSIGI